MKRSLGSIIKVQDNTFSSHTHKKHLLLVYVSISSTKCNLYNLEVSKNEESKPLASLHFRERKKERTGLACEAIPLKA